jgi:hypothetical protein
MPRATGWAPALLPSRGGVTARPTPSGSIPNSDSAAVIRRSRKPRNTFTIRCPSSGLPGKLAMLNGLQVLLPFQFFDHTGSPRNTPAPNGQNIGSRFLW